MKAGEGARELAWIREQLQEPLPVPAESAVIVTSLQGQIAYWSPAAERLYGWTAEEAVGRDILEVTPSRQSREQAAQIMGVLQAGRHWQGKIELRRRDGSPVHVFVLDIPVGDWTSGQGAIVGVSVPAEHWQLVDRRAERIADAVQARFSAAGL